MADATKPLVGRSVGHERAVFVATSGHFCWPPTGSSEWPLTGVRRSMSAMLRAVVNHEFIPCWVFARRRCLPSKSVKTRWSAGLPLQSR